MITNSWLTIMRNIMYGDSDAVPTHLAMGSGDTAVTAGDTTLDTEVCRYAIDSRTKPGASKVMLQGTIPAGSHNGTTFKEVGAFNAASGVTMVNRQINSAGILKSSSVELRYQIIMEFVDI